MDILRRIAGTAGNFVENRVEDFFNDLNKKYQQNLQNVQQQYNQLNQARTHAFKAFDERANQARNYLDERVDNPFKGLDPQEIVSSLGKRVMDYPAINFTPLNLTAKSYGIEGPSVGDVAEFGRETLLQPFARGVAETAYSQVNKINPQAELNFKNPVAKYFFGDNPLQTFQNSNRPSREFLRGTGMSETGVEALAPFMIFSGLALDITPFGGGKKKLVDKAGKEIAENVAKQNLKNLLSYEDQLAKLGYNASERASISSRRAQELFQWDAKSANDALNRARLFAEEKKQAYTTIKKTWLAEREVAKTTGLQIGSKFTNIPKEYGWDVVRAIENPKAKIADEARKYLTDIKAQYDELFKNATEADIDINYLENYITHIYKESNKKVDEVMKSASQKFKFAKGRKFMTYEEASREGLTPKYTHPAQIMAEYVKRLEQTKSNIKLINALKKEGLIVDEVVGRNQDGFVAITGKGFPQSVSKNYAGNVVRGQYWAPKEIAKEINHIFDPDSRSMLQKGLDLTHQTPAWLASKAQDIHLAGGVPYTPWNSFSLFAGLGKEYMASMGALNPKRAGTATMAFLRAVSNNKSDDFLLKDHIETWKKIEKLGYKLEPRNMEDLVRKNSFEHMFDDNIIEGLDMAWNRAFSDKTFRNFWPMLQVSFFEDIEQQALAKGMKAIEAEELAGKALQKWYGLTKQGEELPELVDNVLTTALFAQKYRRNTLNVIARSLYGASPVQMTGNLKNPLSYRLKGNDPFSLENKTGTQFVIGAMMTYVLYNVFQKALTGNYMFENPSRHHFELLIPVEKITGDKEDTTVFRLPFGPSLFTIPRIGYDAVKNVANQDKEGLFRNARSISSTLLQGPIGQLSGEDYWGRPIEDLASYYYRQYAHPYMGALNEQGIGPFVDKDAKKPHARDTIMRALEMPFKFTDEKAINTAYYYDAYNPLYKSLTEDQKVLVNKSKELNKDKSPKGTIAENRYKLENFDVVRFETMIAKEQGKKDGDIAPFHLMPEDAQKIILEYKSLPYFHPRKEAIEDENISWLVPYWQANEEYYAEKGLQFEDDGRPRLTPELQELQEMYFNLPKGDPRKRQILAENPEIVQYWEDNTNWKNEWNKKAGFPEYQKDFVRFNSSGSSYNRYSSSKKPFNRYSGLRSKKITSKAIKMKELDFTPVKVTMPKGGFSKYTMSKPPKVPVVKPNRISLKVRTK